MRTQWINKGDWPEDFYEFVAAVIWWFNCTGSLLMCWLKWGFWWGFIAYVCLILCALVVLKVLDWAGIYGIYPRIEGGK